MLQDAHKGLEAMSRGRSATGLPPSLPPSSSRSFRAGPWLTGVLHDTAGNYLLAFALGATLSALSTIAIWRAAPRKVRVVAGQMHRTPAPSA
jgi:hypothetical protein